MTVFFLVVATILFIINQTIARHAHIEFCKMQSGKYVCTQMPRHILKKIAIPTSACNVHDCSSCIISKKTYLISPEFDLLQPTGFLLRPAQTPLREASTSYTCTNTNSNHSCECDEKNCNGPPEFCSFRHCSNSSNCVCTLTYKPTDLLAITADITLKNPHIVTFNSCFFEKKKISHVTRRILEHEQATFSHNNLTILFQDPILTLPGPGKVIIRTADYEHILDVPQDPMITLPFELLAFKSVIDIIYLHPNGNTIMGQIHVAGKTVCQLKYCILCREVFQHIQCLPTFLRYFIYSTSIVMSLISLFCIKLILKTIIFLSIFICRILYAVYKCCKLFARCALLLGAYLGSSFRETFHRIFNLLENHAAHRAPLQLLPLLLATLCICNTATHVQAECNTHSIIKSDLRACETLHDGSQECHIQTTAEITLNTLAAESCLYFSDDKNNHLFTLSIKLDSVTCTYHKERLYFTFPVKTRHISQISCIFNMYCGRGVHCRQQVLGFDGLNFEAETPESRTFVGQSSCLPGGLGVGCTVLTRAACNFFRVWYEPDLLKSYEVSSITGHKCQYHISVKHTENNTVSRLMISDSAYTQSGIKITILGAFDQPQLHLTENFVQRVGNPNEAYLARTSDKNFPVAGQIGAVQANTSFTTNFLFDPNISQCDYFEDTLRCNTAPDALQHLTQTKEFALPLQRDIHLFSTKDNTLQSTLLMSSAVKVQLNFQNYKISVKTVTICPQFNDEPIIVRGCYNCPIFARLSFKALSTCQEGVVSLHFQQIKVFTQAIRLLTEPSTHVIKFYAEEKCYTEKLCLKSPTMIQCQTIDFCLNEPSIELIQLNTNYSNIASVSTSYDLWDYIKFPNLNSTFFMFKYIGSILLVICLAITAFSTIITCCCRGR